MKNVKFKYISKKMISVFKIIFRFTKILDGFT